MNDTAIWRYDVTSRITWLEFDGKPEASTIAALKANGWRWSGYRKQWYNNRHFPTMPAGLVTTDGGQCEYAAERSERLQDRAAKHAQASTAAYERSNAAVAMIPLGQPILIGHHSERGHRAALARSHRAMDKSVQEAHTAERLQQAAADSARHQARKQTPEAMQRRVDRLSADLRKMERNPWSEQYAAEWQRRVDALTAEIAELQQHIADAGGIRADRMAAQGIVADVGDMVRIHGFIGVIVRVNPKTYTVRLKDNWTLKLDRTRLQEVIAKKGAY